MKPGIPWSIKGIESETRVAAKAAAHRSGLTLGQWLNAMIQEEAAQQARDEAERNAASRRATSKKAASFKTKSRKKHKKSKQLKPAKINKRLEALAEQLSDLANQHQDTAVNRFVGYDDESAAARALEAMIERIESNETDTKQSFEAVNTRLDGIDQKLTPAEEEKPGPGVQALETAVRNIVEHIESSEKRNHDALGSMQEHLSEISKRTEQAENEAINKNAPAISGLEARISELSLQLEQVGNASHDSTKTYIDDKLASLGEQIDAVRHSSDAMTKRAETSAADIAKKEVRESEQRVASLIGEARSLMLKAGPGEETLNAVHNEIESLNQRFDDIKADAASERDMEALKVAVEQLTTSVTANTDTGALIAVEERLNELSKRFDEAPATDHLTPQFAELENRIAQLDDQIVEAISNKDDSASLAAIETQIAGVSDRLTATEEKLDALATIEQSISQLYASVEESRTYAEEVAENTASRVSEQVMASVGAAGMGQGPSPELSALENGLTAVRQSAEAADKHNQETLEAVHETLEQIITKLTDLETREAAASAMAVPVAGEQQPQPALQMVGTEPVQTGADGGNVDWQAAVQSHLHEGVNAEQSAPAVPENVFGSPEVVSPAFNPGEIPETAAPSEPLLAAIDETAPTMEGQMPASGDLSAPGEPQAPLDYIAQARLASQTASPESKNALGMGAGILSDKLAALKGGKKGKNKEDTGEKKAKKPLFTLPFLNKKNKKSEEEHGLEEAVNIAQGEGRKAGKQGEADGGRKRLIIAGLLLLVATGAFAFSKFGGGDEVSKPKASVPAPAITAPAKPSKMQTPATPQKAVVPLKLQRPQASASDDDSEITRKIAALMQRPNNAAAPAPALPVQQVSVIAPLPQTVNPLLTAAQTGMPGPAALEATNAGVAAPVEPVTTASVPPAPASEPALAETQMPPAATGSEPLRQAAAKGDPAAQFVIATRFIEGKTVTRDYSQAASWYQKAASTGLAPAQYRLGTLFERGNGLPKDANAARLWYERAAENGNVKAMHNLAVIYANSGTDKQSYESARKWFEKASSFGLKDSQYNLAVILERGLAGERDQAKAFFWYTLAAAAGDSDAKLKAHSLKNYLSDKDRKAQEKAIAAWKPQKPSRVGNFVAIKDKTWLVASSKPAKPKLGPKPKLSGAGMIKEAQALLGKLGYDVGSHDGVMGSRTANAVRLFQLQNGLAVNGMVSNDLLQQLQARS